MKGIVLAGGSGTRLYPITEGISKQLVAVYDKPMIYYPLSVLMLAGIKDILIITRKEDQESFKKLLKDGSDFWIKLDYVIQPSPDGLAQAFILGADFIKKDNCAMVLGDNIFYGNGLVKHLREARINAKEGNATIFGYRVKDPQRFGVMEFDDNNYIIGIEEKPKEPKSDYAVTGLYFYDNSVIEKAKEIKPSKRNELEITDLNNLYLKEKRLKARLLGGGYTWFDTGTFNSLLDASNMMKSIQDNSGRIVGCLEQIGYDQNWLKQEYLLKRAELMNKNSYGEYLEKVAVKVRKR